MPAVQGWGADRSGDGDDVGEAGRVEDGVGVGRGQWRAAGMHRLPLGDGDLQVVAVEASGADNDPPSRAERARMLARPLEKAGLGMNGAGIQARSNRSVSSRASMA